MQKLRGFMVMLACLVAAGCATTGPDGAADDSAMFVPEPGSIEGLTMEGARVLGSQQFPKKAIEDYFNPAISQCEAMTQGAEARLYVARTPAETIYYMLLAAADERPAQVIASACPDAYYLKAYASLDLGKVEQAEASLRKALEWSPQNSMFLSELGHIAQVKRDWEGSIEYFEKARDSADSFSPEEIKVPESTRALRGIGFALVELGRLDDAEAQFNAALAIDPDDQNVQQELEYIEQLRSGSPP